MLDSLDKVKKIRELIECRNLNKVVSEAIH